MRIRVAVTWLSTFSVVLALSGCTSGQQHNTTIQTHKLSNLHLVSEAANAIPISLATNSESAALAILTFKLSNGKTITAKRSDIKYIINMGDFSMYAIQVPEISETTYFILYLTKKGALWSLAAVMGAPVFPISGTNGLSVPFSKWNTGNLSVPSVGQFNEIYTKNHFVTLANISFDHATMPSGKQIKLRSGRIVTNFTAGNVVGLYYPNGSHWTVMAGNVSNSDLLQLANSKA